MTYFGFLILFVVGPIFLLAGWLLIRFRAKQNLLPSPRLAIIAIAIHILLAVVYTTPWDNYLVATGVWGYDPALVTGIVLGYVPIEEYTFFVVETILSGLVWLFLAWHFSKLFSATQPADKHLWNVGAALVMMCTWASFAWLLFFGSDAWNYITLILFWALPPISLQLAFGADILWKQKGLAGFGVLIPSVYLSLTDIIALNAGTWHISPSQTLGIRLFGILPIEEVVFFFVTNILIVFGLTLALSPQGSKRLESYRSKLRSILGKGVS